MKGILGIKLGMSQFFTPAGERLPVTLVSAAGCKVVQIKTKDKDGYEAVQMGVGRKSPAKLPKALLRHFEKAKTKPSRWLREILDDGASAYALGQEMTLDFLKAGDRVHVRGTTKGHGFSGGIKRWNFEGGPGAHGSCFHRRGGSIGNHTYPKHVFKKRKMPGHYGVEKQTVLNVQVVDVLKNENLLVLKGALPGARNSLVEVRLASQKA